MKGDFAQRLQGRQISSLLLRAYLALAVPILLILFSARLVMNPIFLELEYRRSGFPDDPYGFTQDERLHYATYAINYLFNDADISYLANLTFPDGFRLYTDRELDHMADVKVVTRRAFQLLAVGSGFTILLGLGIWFTRDKRPVFLQGLFLGSAFTLVLIGCVAVAAIIAWDSFFTTFHELFFESGTWRFAYSDTLIRLFPQQFWFDTALTVGILTAIWAFIILGLAWRFSGLHYRVNSRDLDGNECF